MKGSDLTTKKKCIPIILGIFSGLVLGYTIWTIMATKSQGVMVEWHYRVTGKNMIAAEEYMTKHPPKPLEFTWKRFWRKLTHPSDPSQNVARVTLMEYSDGEQFIQLSYPRRTVSLKLLTDGSWQIVDPTMITTSLSGRTRTTDSLPLIGRMFEKHKEKQPTK